MPETGVGKNRIRARGAWLLSAICTVGVLAAPVPIYGQDAPLPAPKIGAGMRASFVHTDPSEEESTDQLCWIAPASM